METPPIRWNQLTLEAIKLSKTPVPLAARALAMVYTAMYDAWSVYDDAAISTTTARYIKAAGNKCADALVDKAYSYAAYRVLMDLFCLHLPPENKGMFNELMCHYGYDIADTTLDIKTPQGVGNLIARLVIERGYGDASNSFSTLRAPRWSDYTGYRPVNTCEEVKDLNYWQPLREEIAPGEFKIQDFLVPQWGLLRSFGLNCNWQFCMEPPFRKDQPAFRQQASELIAISATLTEEQKAIAGYWGEESGTITLPGRWLEIAQFIAEREHYKNQQSIKLFFVMGNAVYDAAISCWWYKHHYNSVRPVTAVRKLFEGIDIQAWSRSNQCTQTMKGEEWLPFLDTPATPEHVSAMSSISRAAATVLKHFTCSDDFGGCTTLRTGAAGMETSACKEITLDWPTFTAAAEQAGLAGLYGGIHFKRGNEEGEKLGLFVGDRAWEKALFYFNS